MFNISKKASLQFKRIFIFASKDRLPSDAVKFNCGFDLFGENFFFIKICVMDKYI